jgi:hypothetical protein
VGKEFKSCVAESGEKSWSIQSPEQVIGELTISIGGVESESIELAEVM